MDYLGVPQETMETLVCVIDADSFVCIDDFDIRVRIGEEFEVSVDEACLQALVKREWLELVDLPDGKGGTQFHINVTSSGLYHGNRFAKLHDRAARKARRAHA